MAGSSVLHWLDGNGWLVLSGGVAVESEIRARVLERAISDGGVAYISVNAPDYASALDDMDDLGAPTGYLVDILVEDDDTVRKSLGEASVIVIEDTTAVEELRAALVGAAVEGIQAAFERGAIILIEGAGIAAFGAWLASVDDKLLSGLDWVKNTLIIPAVTSLSDSQTARTVWQQQDTAVGIGIASGSALALGPQGEIELWGNRQVTIALGPGYRGN